MLLTITEVRPSKDLKNAKVFVSSVGGNEERVAEALNNSSGFFSKLIAKEIKTKYTPKLHFCPDLVNKKASSINKIINQNEGA